MLIFIYKWLKKCRFLTNHKGDPLPALALNVDHQPVILIVLAAAVRKALRKNTPPAVSFVLHLRQLLEFRLVLLVRVAKLLQHDVDRRLSPFLKWDGGIPDQFVIVIWIRGLGAARKRHFVEFSLYVS